MTIFCRAFQRRRNRAFDSFNKLLIMLKTQSIRIASDNNQTHLSKEQKAFNALIKKIDAKRVLLAAWQEAMPLYQQKFASDMVPLIETSQGLQVDLVHALDKAAQQKGLNSTERRTIQELICDMAGGLAAARGDDALKDIYNKHSGSDFDAEEAAAMQDMKSMLEGELGTDLGDDIDLNSPDKFFKRAHAHMQAQQEQLDAERQARNAKRKKSAKQLAKEAQQLAEEQQASQSIRELYRKLASALHPDREPDPAERERKTALMQRVNQAYDQNNLLLLLELQLELEHIDQASINNISAGRLKHYNKILKEQLGELEQELLHTEGMFRMQFDIDPYTPISPRNLLRYLATDIAGMQLAIRSLKSDLLAFQDIKQLKAWLKAIRVQQIADDLDFPF